MTPLKRKNTEDITPSKRIHLDPTAKNAPTTVHMCSYQDSANECDSDSEKLIGEIAMDVALVALCGDSPSWRQRLTTRLQECVDELARQARHERKVGTTGLEETRPTIAHPSLDPVDHSDSSEESRARAKQGYVGPEKLDFLDNDSSDPSGASTWSRLAEIERNLHESFMNSQNPAAVRDGVIAERSDPDSLLSIVRHMIEAVPDISPGLPRFAREESSPHAHASTAHPGPSSTRSSSDETISVSTGVSLRPIRDRTPTPWPDHGNAGMTEEDPSELWTNYDEHFPSLPALQTSCFDAGIRAPIWRPVSPVLSNHVIVGQHEHESNAGASETEKPDSAEDEIMSSTGRRTATATSYSSRRSLGNDDAVGFDFDRLDELKHILEVINMPRQVALLLELEDVFRAVERRVRANEGDRDALRRIKETLAGLI